MTVEVNELVSVCQQTLGLGVDAIAIKLDIDPQALESAFLFGGNLDEKHDAAAKVLICEARAVAEQDAARDKLHRNRGLSDDELINACGQISDSAETASLIEAAIEAGVDSIVEAK